MQTLYVVWGLGTWMVALAIVLVPSRYSLGMLLVWVTATAVVAHVLVLCSRTAGPWALALLLPGQLFFLGGYAIVRERQCYPRDARRVALAAVVLVVETLVMTVSRDLPRF